MLGLVVALASSSFSNNNIYIIYFKCVQGCMYFRGGERQDSSYFILLLGTFALCVINVVNRCALRKSFPL